MVIARKRVGRAQPRGQVAVLFAIAAVAIVGVVGLAVDGGTSFVDQRALQAGADTAATAGATLLAADFRACVSSSSMPYSSASIDSIVAALGRRAEAASGAATSAPDVEYVWYPATSPAPISIAAFTGQLCSSTGTWVGPSGVEVTTANAHHTLVLQVVGISTAHESALAMANFGIVAGGDFGPFIICAVTPILGPQGQPEPAGTPVALGDTVWVSDPQWWKDESGCITGSADYHGYLHNPSPNPIVLPSAPGGTTTITSGGGCTTGQFPTLTIGQVLTLPLVTNVAGSGHYTITIEALVAVRVTSIAQCRVQGVITTLASNQGGLFICPTSEVPSCTGLAANSAPAALAVQLVK